MTRARSGSKDFPRLCLALVLVATGIACSVDEVGKIPCSDVNNCPTDYPTCSVAGFCVGSAPAARIDVVSGDAQSAVVGTSLPQPLVVKVSDTNGNPVASFTVAWSVTANNGQVSTGTATTGPNGRASISATAGTVAGANSFAATGAGVTGTSFSATGIPDVATDLALTGPASTTAGVAQSFTVTAKDKFANVATGYRGTVTFTSTDGSAALPSAYTFTASDAGTHQFTATLKTAGSRSVTVGDGALTNSTPGITVDAADATTLAVTGFSNPATAGAAATVTVTAKDPVDNTATSYRGTVHVTSDNPSAVLPGNYTFTAADSGVHGLSVTLKKASAISTFSITATDTVTATITGSQSSIAVHPDVAATLQVAGFNNPATAGTSGFLVVTAFDAFTNIASGYLGTVHFTSSDGAATVPADYTFTVADAGVHTFSATLKTAAASSSITATDTVTATITGSQSGILVNPGTTTKLLVNGYPNPASAITGGSVTVTAADANNNTTPAYRGTIHFTSDSPNTTLPGDYTFVAGDNGAHTFAGVILKKKSPPNYSITATDTVTATITGAQTAIVVNPGTTTKLLVTGFPNPASADTGGSVTVAAADANNNVTPT